MPTPAALDPDLLRAFAFIAEEGSFTRAAERVGRTQSAVSMQVQRLEAMLGRKVLERGRGGAVSLTPHGKFLLDRSRELLALNDAIWTTFHAPTMTGTVRLGTPDDYALRYLPGVLRRFADSHPAVEVAVTCAPSSTVVRMLRADELDLTLCSEGHEPQGMLSDELWRGALVWVTAQRASPHLVDPLPLALASGDCRWRLDTLGALERAGRRYRIAYSSATLAGTIAPVLAGLAVTVAAATTLPDGVRALRPEEGLPALPPTAIRLLCGGRPLSPAAQRLADHIRASFESEVRATS